MTGFYKNMSTGDYDEYRDTDEVIAQHHMFHKYNENEQKKYDVRQPRFTSEDLRPVGSDDDEY